MRTSLTRTVGFTAIHRYWKDEWSDAVNRERFGAAAVEHSHHYACGVTVTGALEPDRDMLLDLATLDRILAAHVVEPMEGRALHRDLPEFAGGRALPTCEALARAIWRRLESRLPEGVTLERVRVAEDETLSAECHRT